MTQDTRFVGGTVQKSKSVTWKRPVVFQRTKRKLSRAAVKDRLCNRVSGCSESQEATEGVMGPRSARLKPTSASASRAPSLRHRYTVCRYVRFRNSYRRSRFQCPIWTLESSNAHEHGPCHYRTLWIVQSPAPFHQWLKNQRNFQLTRKCLARGAPLCPRARPPRRRPRAATRRPSLCRAHGARAPRIRKAPRPAPKPQYSFRMIYGTFPERVWTMSEFQR